MASTFGVDSAAVAEVGRDLAEVRASLMESFLTRYEGASGSARVEEALHHFYSESSDCREAMSSLLERASGLLRGLAEGTASVDAGLAGTLQPPPVSTVARVETAAGGSR